MLGEDCPPVKGCAFYGDCRDGKVCMDDPHTEIGFRCVPAPNPCNIQKCQDTEMCVPDNDNKDGYYCKNYNGFAYERTLITAIGNLGPEFKIAFDIYILTFGDIDGIIIEFDNCFFMKMKLNPNTASEIVLGSNTATNWQGPWQSDGKWHHFELGQTKKNDKVREYNYNQLELLQHSTVS